MFNINGNEIEMTRGDTVAFQVYITGYKPQDDDEIVMTIKKRITDKSPVLTKCVEDGVVVFEPKDTISLLGTYVYDIQITTALGAVYTPVQSVISFERGVTE